MFSTELILITGLFYFSFGNNKPKEEMSTMYRK